MTPETMHVICLAPTGHVIAAMAKTTGSADPNLEDLTGPLLELNARRSTSAGTSTVRHMASPIPLELMELKEAPYNPSVIASPLDYAIDGGAAAHLPDTAPPSNALPLTANTIRMVGLVIDTLALSIVCDAGNPREERRIQSGKFQDDGTGSPDPLVLPLSLMPEDTPASLTAGKDYDILSAIQGMRMFWGAQAI